MSTNELLPVTLPPTQATTVDLTVGSRANEVSLDRDIGRPDQASQDSTNQAKEATANLTAKDVREVAKFLNESAHMFNVSLNFKVNEDVGRIVVTVVDSETKEVIRQIPPDDVINLATRLSEMVGVLFNETA